MTVDHDPRLFVGHLQPKSNHYIAARATNELRIGDGKFGNESEAFTPGVVALVVRGAGSLQPCHQLFVLLQRPHTLLKGNDLRAGSDHVVRHFSPAAVGQSEAARVVGHDPNFVRSHAARTTSVEIDRRISADTAGAEQKSEQWNPHAARSKDQTKHGHAHRSAEKEGKEQGVGRRRAKLSGVDVGRKGAKPQGDHREPRSAGQKERNEARQGSFFGRQEEMKETT